MNLNYRNTSPPVSATIPVSGSTSATASFHSSEALQLEPMLQDFVASWNSHGDQVKGYANLFFGQFIILMAR